jgi:hypothetical protein
MVSSYFYKNAALTTGLFIAPVAGNQTVTDTNYLRSKKNAFRERECVKNSQSGRKK